LRSLDAAALALAGLLFATAASAGVTASDAWVRGMVPGQKTTAAYLTLKSSEDAKVVGIASSVGRAELHTSMMMSGVAHMHALDALALPAGKSVALRPAGDHVMLMQIAKPLRAGDKVPLTLTIEDARGKRSTLEVQATVKPIAE
jgi:copper(I)-binding protein